MAKRFNNRPNDDRARPVRPPTGEARTERRYDNDDDPRDYHDRGYHDNGAPNSYADYDHGDHLHPHDAGYKAMAESIDLSVVDAK